MLYEKDTISTEQIYDPGIYREKDTEGRKHEKASIWSEIDNIANVSRKDC